MSKGKPVDRLPEVPRALLVEQRAATLNDLGRYAEALTAVGPQIAANPHDEGLLVQAAVALIELDREPEALSYLRAARAADPESVRVHKLMSLALRGAGQPQEAYRAAVHATRLAPSDPGAHIQVARSACELNDRTNGLQAARYAVHLDPTSAQSHLAVSDVVMPEGRRPSKADLSLAQEHVTRALQLEPGNPVALNEMARIQMARGRLVSAAGHLSSSVRSAPGVDVMQRNMDQVLIGLVGRFHWVLFLVWFAGSRVIVAQHMRPSRWLLVLLGVVGVAVVAVIGRRLQRQVPASMRAGFVRGFGRRQKLCAAWGGCLLLTSVLFFTAAVAPIGWALGLFFAGGVPMAFGAVLSWVTYLRNRRR
ncbi:tetratricopeptide repeat protein [Lapillicoccus sp.]|uniref:tetratricopeptide repeat protein n=1 Tax=Lapillicoccus sp. TaxID=1909287 RepID=UPI00326613C2